MNKTIKCPHCGKVFFDLDNEKCPLCGKLIHDVPNFMNDVLNGLYGNVKEK